MSTNRPGRPRAEPAQISQEERLERLRELFGVGSNVEEVVLESPEDLTPSAHGQPASDESAESDGSPRAHSREKARTRRRRSLLGLVFAPILYVFRLPEKALRHLWYRSFLRHSMREHFEWFRDMEEARLIGRTLESTYGGPNHPRFKLQKFLRNNVLFTLLLGVACVGGGRAGVANLLLHLDPNRAMESSYLVRTPSSGAAPSLQEVGPGTELPGSEQLRLERELAHCTVSPDARRMILGSMAPTSEFTEDAPIDAIRVVRRFQDRYRTLEISTELEDVRRRRDSIARLIQPLLDDVSARAQGLRARRLARQSAIEALEDEQRKLPLQQVQAVNRSIQIREQIDRIEKELVAMADVRLLDRLESLAHKLSKRLTSTGIAEPWGKTVLDLGPGWIERAAVMSPEALASSVGDLVIKDMQAALDGLNASTATSTVTYYHARRVTDLLAQLDVLLDVVWQRSSELLTRLEIDQTIANERFTAAFELEPEEVGSRVWVNYRPCLAQLDHTQGALGFN